MFVYTEQQLGNYRAIRFLFVIGLVGLIVAGSGIAWLVIGYAQLVQQTALHNAQLTQRAALYSGHWVPEGGRGILTDLNITNDGLILTVHPSFVFGGSTVACTGSRTFTGEPFIITIPSSGDCLSYDLNITMILYNADATRLKVTVNTDTTIFHKNGS